MQSDIECVQSLLQECALLPVAMAVSHHDPTLLALPMLSGAIGMWNLQQSRPVLHGMHQGSQRRLLTLAFAENNSLLAAVGVRQQPLMPNLLVASM
jgi:hypothetical protein